MIVMTKLMYISRVPIQTIANIKRYFPRQFRRNSYCESLNFTVI